MIEYNQYHVKFTLLKYFSLVKNPHVSETSLNPIQGYHLRNTLSKAISADSASKLNYQISLLSYGQSIVYDFSKFRLNLREYYTITLVVVHVHRVLYYKFCISYLIFYIGE